MDDLFYSLRNPDNLHIMDSLGDISFGCNQEWYSSDWQRSSGCGPSVASNIMLYMHRSKTISLPQEVNNKSECTKLMETVWDHVTPTNKGIYLLAQFCDGLHSFIRSNGYMFESFSLNIPDKNKERPELPAIVHFIAQGLINDCPIAFLNLSNGMISNLDRWHWVTIVSLETDQNNSKVLVNIYDGEESINIDLKFWYETTTLGGGFVYFQKGQIEKI